MIFSGINHVAIIASDIEKSKIFYTDILGFKLITRIDRPEKSSDIIYLDAGNFIIELFSFAVTPSRLSRPEAAGLRHLALNVENFDFAVTELTSRGVILEEVRIDLRTGKRHTFFADPDNLPIEVCEK